jgi:hypothetical protein
MLFFRQSNNRQNQNRAKQLKRNRKNPALKANSFSRKAKEIGRLNCREMQPKRIFKVQRQMKNGGEQILLG